MSPPLEAALIGFLGALIIVAGIIAWALLRLARGGDRWTTAANTLSNRVTATENRLTALEGTVDALCRRDGSTGLPGAVTGNQHKETP